MSKRSAHSVKNRARNGVQSNRRIDAHILEARTVRLAQLVAKSLKPIIKQEVRDEFDRRAGTSVTEENEEVTSQERTIDCPLSRSPKEEYPRAPQGAEQAGTEDAGPE